MLIGEVPVGPARPDTTPAPHRAAEALVFGLGLIAAAAIRFAIWPSAGLRGDIDQFVLWVHGLATQPFGRAYDQNLTFGPVMVYIWGALAAIEPAFRTATDAADPVIRALMKLPASIADLAIAGLVWFHLRHESPRLAVGAALAIALHPALIYVSAWWGQYESIFVMLGVAAFVLAVRGHSLLAAALVAAALMTKPQALPFLVPFGAWFLAREGWRGAARAALVGLVTIAILWLPFLTAGGPVAYLHNLDVYANEIFPVASLRAWNLWWLVQQLLADGSFVSDKSALVGGLTLRLIGIGLTVAVELVILVAVFRRPTARQLAIGLTASVLVVFTFLTTMHERYAFGALALLLLALPDRRVLWLWIVLSVVFTLNLFAAVPPTAEVERLLPVGGLLGMVGSVAMLILTAIALGLLAQGASRQGAGLVAATQ